MIVEHRLTITIEQREDGKLTVSTEGMPADNWLRRDVRNRRAFALAMLQLAHATDSQPVDPLLALEAT